MDAIQQICPEGSKNHLDDTETLWRYISLPTLIVYLTGHVFVPSIKLLRSVDPFEGEFHFDEVKFRYFLEERFGDRVSSIEHWIHSEMCSQSEREIIKANHESPNYASRKYVPHYFAFLRKTRFAWCWFRSNNESAAMWNTYGHNGAAIRTTVGKLRKVLGATGRKFLFGRMRYVHYENSSVRDLDWESKTEDAEFLLRPHFVKRDEYRTEEEVRFVTAGPDPGIPGIILEELSVDWIEQIRLWPGLKATERTALQRAVESLAPAISCSCSDLLGADPGEDREFVPPVVRNFDQFFLDEWEKGDDGVPQELKML